jgi:hypothetical protein
MFRGCGPWCGGADSSGECRPRSPTPSAPGTKRAAPLEWEEDHPKTDRPEDPVLSRSKEPKAGVKTRDLQKPGNPRNHPQNAESIANNHSLGNGGAGGRTRFRGRGVFWVGRRACGHPPGGAGETPRPARRAGRAKRTCGRALAGHDQGKRPSPPSIRAVFGLPPGLLLASPPPFSALLRRLRPASPPFGLPVSVLTLAVLPPQTPPSPKTSPPWSSRVSSEVVEMMIWYFAFSVLPLSLGLG